MNIAELNQIIEQIDDPQDRDISMAMAVLMLALEFGPSAKRLAQKTGYCKFFVDAIAKRMQEAGLWHGGLVDDTEWLDEQGELRYVALYMHALVALGQLKRHKTLRGALYINASTGEIEAEWEDFEAGGFVN